jgi:streptogramin lyase
VRRPGKSTIATLAVGMMTATVTPAHMQHPIGRLTALSVQGDGGAPMTLHQIALSGSTWGVSTGPTGDRHVWVVQSGRIARLDSSGVVADFVIPPLTWTGAGAIIAGPDNAMWFTEEGGAIGRITLTGEITLYPVTGKPVAITVGPDASLWFADYTGSIGRITTGGAVTTFPARTSNPQQITAGTDGRLWYSSYGASGVYAMTITGTVTPYETGLSGWTAPAITSGPDGMIWVAGGFEDEVVRMAPTGDVLSRLRASHGTMTTSHFALSPLRTLWLTNDGWLDEITVTGNLVEHPIPGISSFALASGPLGDCRLWITESYSDAVATTVAAPCLSV